MTGRGFFVVLEGPEGAGKSTLAAALAARMRERGADPVVVREPGGTPAGELARQALLDPDHPVGPIAELFFYLAARAELVDKVIRPALEEGRVVLSDRFSLSTEAYQIAGRGLAADLVRPAGDAATRGLRPDLILVLDLDPEIGRARQVAAGKRLDRLDQESLEFHRRVAAHYLAVRGDGVQHSVKHLDGTASPDRLLHGAWDELCRARPEIFGIRER
jgi:dTMP kinase